MSRKRWKLGERDGWVCGAHLGGCGQLINRNNPNDSDIGHIVSRDFLKDVDVKGQSQGNVQIMHPECNKEMGMQMNGMPVFKCSCHHFLWTDDGDLEIWYLEPLTKKWEKLFSMWKEVGNNSYNAQTIAFRQGCYSVGSHGFGHYAPGPRVYQRKKGENMEELFRTGRYDLCVKEWDGFKEDYTAYGCVFVQQVYEEKEYGENNILHPDLWIKKGKYWVQSPYLTLCRNYAFYIWSKFFVRCGVYNPPSVTWWDDIDFGFILSLLKGEYMPVITYLPNNEIPVFPFFDRQSILDYILPCDADLIEILLFYLESFCSERIIEVLENSKGQGAYSLAKELQIIERYRENAQNKWELFKRLVSSNPRDYEIENVAKLVGGKSSLSASSSEAIMIHNHWCAISAR